MTTPIGQVDGIITLFYILGPKARAAAMLGSGEGVPLVVPGILKFNHTVHGEHVYIRTS